MKLFFAIVVLTLLVQSYAHHHSSWENLNRRQGSRMNSESSSGEDFNSHNNQRWNNWNRELDDNSGESHSSSSSTYQFKSDASQLPQAEYFKTKIVQRLNGSDSLSMKPDLKRKLINVADQKLENCKTPSGQELDRHCVGRTTGQMMQMIAAVENNNRQPIWKNYRSFE